MFKSNLNNITNQIKTSKRDVFVLPVVKGRNKQDFENLRKVGLFTVGENRVQEFLKHYELYKDFKWHFVGQLQTNKVKYLIGKCDLIHSLDRLPLAHEINRLSQKADIITNCLIELNILNEYSKGGLPLDKNNIEKSGIQTVGQFLLKIEKYENIKVKGLMAVMPKADDETLSKYFASLEKIFTYFKSKNNFEILSAGMSNDYKIAIKYSVNMIRLGRVLFD